MEDFRRIREIAITAVFTDDDLFEQLALKGGNAIAIGHGLEDRASVDIDVSLEGDFEDPERAEAVLLQSIRDRYAENGFVVFDEKFEARPRNASGKWGGYKIEFKLIGDEGRDLPLEDRRRRSKIVAPGDQKKFKIDISKHEYFDAEEIELDDFAIRIYTLPLIVMEKLRAICQQTPSYPHRKNPASRPRDFFDIHRILEGEGIDLCDPQNLQLLDPVFSAKDVDFSLYGEVVDQRGLHREGWESVLDSLSSEARGKALDFDGYFDYVLELYGRLESSRVE